MPACRMQVPGQREPRDRLALLHRDVDRGVGMPADRAEVAPLVVHAAPFLGRQKPRALLAADLARKLDERLRVTRLGGTDRDHGTTIP